MKRFSDFIHFDAEDFAADESFQSYVRKSSEEDTEFWEEFLRLHPEKRPEVREASDLLSRLNFKPAKLRRQLKQSELHRLLAALPASDKIGERALPRNHRPLRFHQRLAQRFRDVNVITRLAVAACTIIVVSLGFYASNLFLHPTITYRTEYGENATYLLPDSSVITLNSNSTLVHQSDWQGGGVREVWLEGEAFFDVKHLGPSAKSRFIVHTAGMDVEVLGTRFNVFNRTDKVNVVLNAGKVKVRLTSSSDTSGVVMMPDESLEFSRKDLTVVKKQVKAEMLTSWRNHVLIFDNTPLSRIGEIIEYTYGMKVVFRDNVDATEKLAGTVPCDSLEVLLDVLAKSSNLHITREKDTIIIAKQ